MQGFLQTLPLVKQRQAFLKQVTVVTMSDLLAFSKISNEINSSLADCGFISVPFNKKAGIDISLYTLKNIWASAAELVQNSHITIMPAPCLSEHISRYSVLNSMRSSQDSQLVTFNTDLGMFSLRLQILRGAFNM